MRLHHNINDDVHTHTIPAAHAPVHRDTRTSSARRMAMKLAIIFLLLAGLVMLAGVAAATSPPGDIGYLTNNATNLTISTADGSGEVVHPSVIYNASGWNGYTYLMGITSYTNADHNYENPMMRYSNDGVNWVNIPGAPDPIVSYNFSQPNYYYSDPNIVQVGNTLYLFYRRTNTTPDPDLDYIFYKTTTDGITWTNPVQLDIPASSNLCPTFMYNGTGWQCWIHNQSNGDKLEHYYSMNGINYTNRQVCSITTPYTAWHDEVQYFNGRYDLLEYTMSPGVLLFLTSTDGINWNYLSQNPVLQKSGVVGRFDNSSLYKSSFQIVGNKYMVWYGGYTQTALYTYKYEVGLATFTANFSEGADSGNSFNYAKNVNITTGTTQTNYPMKIILMNTTGADYTYNPSGYTPTVVIHVGSKVKSDWSDVRFAQSYNGVDTGYSLPYWHELTNDTATSTTWWATGSCTADGLTGITVYYGNASAAMTTTSNGQTTFPLFDKFSQDGGTINASLWNVQNNVSIIGGYANLTSITTSYTALYSKTSYGTGYSMRARLKTDHFNVNGPQEWTGQYLYSNASNFGSNFYFSDSGATYKGQYVNKLGASRTGQNIVGWSAATYGTVDINRNTTGSTSYVNDANPLYATTNYWTGNTQVAFNTYTTGGSEQVDWVFLRPLANVEPVFGTIGAEQQLLTAGYTSDVSNGVIPFTVQFTDASLGYHTTYAWNFGDGTANATTQNPTHTYTTLGIFTVTLTVSDGTATSSTTGTITANPGAPPSPTPTPIPTQTPGPTAGYTTTPSSGTAPLTVTFADTSSNTVPGATWSWNFGDGATSTFNSNLLPDNIANGAESGSVTGLTVGYGGTLSSTTTAAYGGTHSIKLAMTHGFDYIYYTYNNPQPLTSYTFSTYWKADANSGWTLGYIENGVTHAVGSTYYTMFGWQRVSTSFTTTANPGSSITLEFYIAGAQTNLYLDDIQFEPGNTTTTWNLGYESSLTHTYNAVGNYLTSLTVTNPGGSTSTATNTITTNGPTASFTANPPGGYYPLTVQFTDTSTNEVGGTTWSWNFGDGSTSTSQNPSHTYTSASTFTVTLTTTNAPGVTNTAQLLLYIYNNPGPAWNLVGPTVSPGAISSLMISNDAKNQTETALFGSDPVNNTGASFSFSGLGIAMLGPLAPIGPLLIMVLAGLIGAVLFIRAEGDFTVIMYLLIMTGATTGATTYACMAPAYYYLVAAFMMGLGIFALLYQAIVGRS